MSHLRTHAVQQYKSYSIPYHLVGDWVICGHRPAIRRRLLYPASSTGRRNTLAKSLCWRLEVQRFPRSLIELARHLVQLGLGVRREVKTQTLGEVLAQQAIGVFA